MINQVEQKSIEILKKDFPEHKDAIDIMAEKSELIAELAIDYYTCKRNIYFAEQDRKKCIIQEYEFTLNDLKEEIVTLLNKNRVE